MTSNLYKWLLVIPLVCVAAVALNSCKGKKANEGHALHQEHKDVYTCSMHPQIIRDKPGKCPICGMALIKKSDGNEQHITNIDLNTLLRPTNAFVVSSIPVTTIQKENLPIDIDALGSIAYDTRQVGAISARYSGRIERLYVRYRYQKVTKGQKIMDIYSPELVTAQQNIIFLLKNDPANSSLINAAKQRLLLLGLTNQQLSQLIRSGKPSLTVSVYSNYTGHLHETTGDNTMAAPASGVMKDISLTTEELSLKEGMYVQKGQAVFQVYNPNRVWAALSIYAEMQTLIKVGNPVKVIPETAPHKQFRGTIGFIEPFFKQGSKTVTARVYLDNSTLQVPIGSQVRATIFGNSGNTAWLPADAIVSLGLDKVIFIKQPGGFKARKVTTGLSYQNKIQVVSGLGLQDSVAQNAQYLMDSESFIKVNE
ncbi:Cu(I)/Ag(I) efflux system membrane fusion protein [Sediminibacterium magnilacihabitans]|jgi:Cu(I)/Ag(I) efflux system membrane fusion protein|nr:Cu(I)/Ag(I) efflux system membrane fusion protein [Sediminibacterium magnilacihabitans]